MTATVYSQKTEKRRDFSAAALHRFAPEMMVRNPKRVLVKPNVVSGEPYPTTTHPEVLDTVLAFLRRFSCQVVVGDGPAMDAGDASRVFADHPLQQVCAAHDLELQNLYAGGFTSVRSAQGFSLHISRTALECDYVISLPVLKPHPNCRMTGALKNQFGLFSRRERFLMHRKLFRDMHRAIAEVNTVVRPHLTIMDAVKTYTEANEMRHGGQPVDLGYMLAGTDPVALDCHGLKLLGKVEHSLAGRKPQDIPHLSWAARIGAGSLEYIVARLLD